MQRACEMNPSAMAAVLALADEKVEEICESVTTETGEVVVPQIIIARASWLSAVPSKE